jgi:phage terminase large subunit
MAVYSPQKEVHVHDLYDRLNPTFYRLLLTDKPNKLTKGGRSGTKSSAISEILAQKKEVYPESNIICFRQKANSLKMSVYNQIMWALNEAGVADQYEFRSNPMTILHKKRRTGFYFMGMDDPQKVKSIKIENGFVSDLWFEEADALRGPEEIDTVQDTFIRNDLPHGLEVNTWVSYNPPRGQYHWINEWAAKLQSDPDWYVHHSTYLDDVRGYNSQQLLRKIENYKKNDYDYYRWQYLGEIIGFGSNVYNMSLFNLIDELPDDDPIVDVAYSADVGHQTSATIVGCFGITAKMNVILLDTWYYSPQGRVKKKAPSELSKEVYEFVKSKGYGVYKYTIDSAEGGFRNQYYLDYGTRWHGVAKKEKHIMIDYTHDLLAQGRFYVLNNKNNKVFLEQCKRYEWDEKTIHSDAPKPIKEEDHAPDCLQYFCTDNLRRLGLKH